MVTAACRRARPLPPSCRSGSCCGGLAAVIVVLEGVQHLYQFQEHWITYRSTAEALKHERYLYLAKAGPYLGRAGTGSWSNGSRASSPKEHAKWTASHQEIHPHPQDR